MSQLIGVIPAAGRGVRAYPYTSTIPKCMLEVDGVPLIRRNLELMRDQLDIRDVRIVTGHHGEVIRDYCGDGSRFGVRIDYVENRRLDLELAYSVYLGTQGLDTSCCVILADECYVGSNHRELLAAARDAALATVGFIESDNPKYIRKNYVGVFADGRIVSLEEKPQVVTGSIMGTGTYVLHPELLVRLRAAFAGDLARAPRDWTSWLGSLCRSGADLRPFLLHGAYVNVNSRDDLNYANYLVRDRTFEDKTASLVYVVDHETDASVRAVPKFAAQPELDEVVVVCRRRFAAVDAVAELAKTRVVVSPEPRTETGALFRLGVDSARGDIVVLAYSDDTFVPHDVAKLLVYLRDADMVVGTRTTRQMIEQGANMRGIVRVVHILLAKLVEILWWRFECRFTDICGVYRAFWRSTWEPIRGNLGASGPEIFPEMVLEALRARKRVIEVPVNYYNRDLELPYVRSKYQSLGVLARVLGVILRKRLQDFGLLRARGASASPVAPAPAAALPADHQTHRRLEREWQDSVGHALLDKPHAAPGSAAVFVHQFDRIADLLRDAPPGVVVEVGCGKGHLLRRLREKSWLAGRTLVGLDLSRAVFALPDDGLAGVEGDGERLPFQRGSVAALVYDGALHHLIDYPQALREAMRVLVPGGMLVLFEPVSSAFSRLMHRLLDPIVFRKGTVYESPIDLLYKARFREDVIVRVLREGLRVVAYDRSDFLAYPFTGCYAGSVFGRSERFMRRLLALEEVAWKAPVMRRVARMLAWRFLIVAVKPSS
jgi:NDP-sugar pyrophosphorylase family protein/SAM-dependent methyltransferase